MHSLVSAQVGELGVGFVANLAPERLDGAVDVRVLLQPARRGEGLAALRAGVAPGPDVRGPDVALQVARVGEHLVAVLTREPPELPVNHFVTEQWQAVRRNGDSFSLVRMIFFFLQVIII